MLQKLANEILCEILSYLAADKQLLCHVAIQSRRLSELVRPILIREVRLVTSQLSKDPASQLIIRSILESDVLASMVHDVSIGWSKGDETIRNIHNMNNKVLERLTRLRSLTIWARLERPLWKHQYLKKNSLEFLTHLELHIAGLTPPDMVKYMFLKSLRSLSISWINKPEVPKLPNSFSYGDSNISSMELGSRFHLPEDVLHEILKYPRSLKTLVTNLPGQDVLNDYPTPSSVVTTPLSPAGVARALEPTKASLMELTLVDLDCDWPGHDDSRTDLRSFIALKKLRIASRCYFLPGNSTRDGIVDFLPASVEELEV